MLGKESSCTGKGTGQPGILADSSLWQLLATGLQWGLVPALVLAGKGEVWLLLISAHLASQDLLGDQSGRISYWP